jgi:cytochrome c oxidase subunit II
MFDTVQSILDPPGLAAALASELAWAVMMAGTLAFAVVMLLAICGLLVAPRVASTRRWKVGTSLAFPVLALTSMAVYGLIIGEAFSSEPVRDSLKIDLASRDSWWEVRYQRGERMRVRAHELRVPVGRQVELVLSPEDSFWGFRVPELAAHADAVPGAATRVSILAREPGRFRVQGTLLHIVASDVGEFETWLARQATPSVAPTDPLLADGRAAFFRSGCDSCHTIRGTAARGRVGPDLTHVGARLEREPGTLDTHLRLAASLATDEQGRELRAVTDYLQSLK